VCFLDSAIISSPVIAFNIVSVAISQPSFRYNVANHATVSLTTKSTKNAK
jgi:hypothetical protein